MVRRRLFHRIRMELSHHIALCLLEDLLRFNPRERISARDAIEYDYVAPFRVIDTEVEAHKRFEDPLSAADLSSSVWKEHIEREIECAYY